MVPDFSQISLYDFGQNGQGHMSYLCFLHYMGLVFLENHISLALLGYKEFDPNFFHLYLQLGSYCFANRNHKLHMIVPLFQADYPFDFNLFTFTETYIIFYQSYLIQQIFIEQLLWVMSSTVHQISKNE